MTQKELIERLYKEGQSNKVARDVFGVWAARRRARGQVSIIALSQRMKKAGFNHTNAQYGELLKFLASLGLGQLEGTRSGTPKVLKNVRLTLQSIGQVGSGTKTTFVGYTRRNKYQAISTPAQERRAEAGRRSTDDKTIAKVWSTPETKSTLGLAYMTASGRVIYLPVPRNLQPNELIELVDRLQGKELE